MTPKQIDLVEKSLPAILALRDRAPARFGNTFPSLIGRQGVSLREPIWAAKVLY
jgi:hypothetical protein